MMPIPTAMMPKRSVAEVNDTRSVSVVFAKSRKLRARPISLAVAIATGAPMTSAAAPSSRLSNAAIPIIWAAIAPRLRSTATSFRRF